MQITTKQDGVRYTDLLEEVEHLIYTTVPEQDTATEVPRSTDNSDLVKVFAAIKAEDDVRKKSEKWEFLYSSQFYQQTISESLLTGMIRRLDMIVEYFGRTIEETLINDEFIDCVGRRLNLLIEFYGHTLDDHLIGHLKLHHSAESESNECGGFLRLHLSANEF